MSRLPLIGLVLPCLPALVSAAEKTEPAFLNSQLVEYSPAFNPWDIGAEFRVRYEVKDDAGVTPNTDFISGIADSREAVYFREKVHVGYKDEWFGVFVEGRDAPGHEDIKADDAFDLHQAYVTLGNAKEFPLTAKIGRDSELLFNSFYFFHS